jgi:hypothetical protein
MKTRGITVDPKAIWQVYEQLYSNSNPPVCLRKINPNVILSPLPTE